MSFNERSYTNYGSQFSVQVGTSGSYTAVNGLNLGNAASGVTVQFNIPADFNDGAALFTVANVGNSNGTVQVSGVSNTINGSAAPLSISNLASKNFYNISGTNWVSF